MTRIPPNVSAAVLQAVIAAGLALTIWALTTSYPRRYLRAWGQMWAALSLYSLASGAALLASDASASANAPLRPALGALVLFATWWHLRSLEEGMRLLCAPEQRTPRWRTWTTGTLLAVAGVLELLGASDTLAESLQSYLLRSSILALAWVLAYGGSGWIILNSPEAGSLFGRRILGLSLIGYGAMHALEPLTHFLGPRPLLAHFITSGGLPLLIAVASGMAVTLLEVERARGAQESAARHDAERTATASEALLATALSSSSDPVLIVDPRGRLMAFNERFALMLKAVRGLDAAPGLPVDQLVGATALDFWRDAFSRAMSGESQTRIEPFVLAPDAPPTQFGIRVTPVRRDGEVVGVLLVAHNATEEERLRAALARREVWFGSMIENSSDIIFQLSPAGTIDYASPSVHRVLGHSPERIIGADAFQYVHPDDVAPLRDAMARSFARDDSAPSALPFRARAQSGEWVALEAVSRPYLEADGTPRLIVAARDVRERLRFEGELLAARRLESVGRLAGGVAHDFNNLLTAVVGNLALIRSLVPPGSPATEHLDEIEHSVKRGADLTRRLLAFARRQTIEPLVLALAPQLASLERLLRRLIGDGVRLLTEVPADLWSVRVDPLALEQILVNLIVNARDALPQGGEIMIRAANLTILEESPHSFGVPAGDWVRLDLRDNGTGIDEAILGRIFEPFFSTKGDAGTGLGLATVYGAVRQAGGQVRVTSKLGVGTTFSLFLPRVVESAAPIVEGPNRSRLARARPGEMILLIEDEGSVREVTTKLLSRLGYQVIAATDGLDGVARAAAYEGTLHLVLSDLTMPGLGGVQAVRQIRERRERLPALFVSGYSEQALDWGNGTPAAGRLLSKPFSIDELANAIRHAIDN